MIEQIEHNLFVKFKELNQIINNANWIPVSACYLYSEKSKNKNLDAVLFTAQQPS